MSETTVTATGHLTGPPELREGESTTKVEFTIASNPTQFRDGQWQKLPTVFTPCVAWGRLAQTIADRLSQGSLVTATGRMRAREYENAQGQTKRFQHLLVDEIGTHLMDRSSSVGQDSTRYGSETGHGGGWGTNPASSSGASNLSPETGEFGGWGSR